MSIAIEQALNTAILDEGLELDIVFDNGIYSTHDGFQYEHSRGVYTPSAERGFLEAKVFPADVSPQSLADSDVHLGLFQVIVKYPNDSGLFAAKEKAQAVLAMFSIGSSITYDAQKVYIDSKRIDGGRSEGGFYQIVVRFNYRAFVTR